MITFYMTPEEARDEVLKDYEEVFKFTDTKDAKFRKRVCKASVFPVRAYSDFVTKRKNKWIVFFEARSKKNTGPNAMLHFVCYINMHDGYYAYMPMFWNERLKYMLIFAPHFFQRYAERAKVDKTGIDLIRHYFTLNPSCCVDSEIKDGIVSMQGVTDEGVCLGSLMHNDIVLLKTFIAWDNTFKEQKLRFLPWMEDVKKWRNKEDEMVRTGIFDK